MAEVRIIAVSFRGAKEVENVSYVWTAGGATPVRRVVEDLWCRRCSYYTVSPSGRVAVTAVPERGPGLLARALGRRTSAHLISPATARGIDSLLTLPRLPSPDRGRRSQQRNSQQHSQQHSLQHSQQHATSQHADLSGA